MTGRDFDPFGSLGPINPQDPSEPTDPNAAADPHDTELPPGFDAAKEQSTGNLGDLAPWLPPARPARSPFTPVPVPAEGRTGRRFPGLGRSAKQAPEAGLAAAGVAGGAAVGVAAPAGPVDPRVSAAPEVEAEASAAPTAQVPNQRSVQPPAESEAAPELMFFPIADAAAEAERNSSAPVGFDAAMREAPLAPSDVPADAARGRGRGDDVAGAVSGAAAAAASNAIDDPTVGEATDISADPAFEDAAEFLRSLTSELEIDPEGLNDPRWASDAAPEADAVIEPAIVPVPVLPFLPSPVSAPEVTANPAAEAAANPAAASAEATAKAETLAGPELGAWPAPNLNDGPEAASPLGGSPLSAFPATPAAPAAAFTAPVAAAAAVRATDATLPGTGSGSGSGSGAAPVPAQADAAGAPPRGGGARRWLPYAAAVVIPLLFGGAVWATSADRTAPVTPAAAPAAEEAAAAPVAEAPIRVLAMGDMLPHDSVNQNAVQPDGSINFAPFFDGIQANLAGADATFCNQEVPSAGVDFGISGYPTFNTYTEFSRDLRQGAGCNIVNLATNHTADKGVEGINATRSQWDGLDALSVSGANRSPEEQSAIQYGEVRGVKTALVSFAEYSNASIDEVSLNFMGDDALVERLLTEARANAQLVIVSAHWGTEDSHDVNDQQRAFAQRVADLGADVVLGTGPHVLQPVEWVPRADGGQTLVWYSLGNMLNTQLAVDQRTGIIASFEVVPGADGGRATVANPAGVLTWMSYEWTPEEEAALQLDARHDLSILPLAAAGEQLARTTYGMTPEQIAEQSAAILGPLVALSPGV